MAIDGLLAAGGSEADEAAERLARAESLVRCGKVDAARADFAIVADVATRTGDAALLARAVLGIGDTAPRWGFDAELVSQLEAAVTALGDGAPALRARVAARLAQALYYSADGDRRRRLARQAESDARQSGDAEALAWVLSAQHDALWGPDDVETRTESATKIVALGGELAHPELQLRGHGLLVSDLLEAGRFEDARAATARHAELSEELNQPIHLRDVEVWRATWALVDGRLDDAERAIIATRELSDTAHDPNGDVIYWIQQYGYVLARGGARELDEFAAAYERLATELPHVPAWRSALAAVHVRRDDRDAVAAIFEAQAAGDFAAIPKDGVWMNALTHLAEACAYLGDGDRAATIHAALRPYGDLMAVVDRGLYIKGSVAHYLGQLDATMGNVADARRWFDRALERHRTLGARFLVQETERELARLT
jgi:tetratricopeptide (TPR) repeat protein